MALDLCLFNQLQKVKMITNFVSKGVCLNRPLFQWWNLVLTSDWRIILAKLSVENVTYRVSNIKVPFLFFFLCLDTFKFLLKLIIVWSITNGKIIPDVQN